MRSSSILVLAAAMLVPAAGRSAAQTPAAPAAATTAAAASTPWGAHPVGKYHLQVKLPDRVMEADLTITESSGQLNGDFLPEGDMDSHPMTVTVKDPDLVLQAETPRGHLEIVLRRDGDHLSGGWTLGTDKGPVEGKTVS